MKARARSGNAHYPLRSKTRRFGLRLAARFARKAKLVATHALVAPTPAARGLVVLAMGRDGVGGL